MLRGRLDYVIPDSPVMLVGSFGLYYSRTKSTQGQLSGTNGGLTAGMTDQAYSNTINLIGGAGVEIRVLPNWTVRTEMLFSQAGTSYQTYDKRHLRDQSNRINARYVQIGTSYRF
jgi:opacity protein-like surface antigen